MFRTLIAAVLVLAGASAVAAEEAKHTVVERDGAFEIRDYQPMMLAQVTIPGPFDAASGRAFRPLFNYISGGNSAPQGGSGEIAMTTPVLQQRSQTIAMTSPVTQQASADGWTVAFVMPGHFTPETLPVPNNARVEIDREPARRMAAIRFSGRPDASDFARQEALLRAELDRRGLIARGEPVYARYDAPYVPGPLRRNEVMLEITE
ncbi:SOUL family heme-binding protein [Maricaulis sp. CAU 1757]